MHKKPSLVLALSSFTMIDFGQKRVVLNFEIGVLITSPFISLLTSRHIDAPVLLGVVFDLFLLTMPQNGMMFFLSFSI